MVEIAEEDGGEGCWVRRRGGGVWLGMGADGGRIVLGIEVMGRLGFGFYQRE